MERAVNKVNQDVYEIGPSNNDVMRLQRLSTEVRHDMAETRGTVEDVNNKLCDVNYQHQRVAPQTLLHHSCARFELGTPLNSRAHDQMHGYRDHHPGQSH